MGSKMSLHIVILAAGQGKRMCSKVPKVLHTLGGKSMLQWVIEAAQALTPQAIHVVYGKGGNEVRKALEKLPVNWVLQSEQLGTGHAVLQTLPHIPLDSNVLILSADVPLIQPETLSHLLTGHSKNKASSLSLLLAVMDNPFGLGRIIRDRENKICSIVEEKDANAEQKQIKEIYTGICCVKAENLAQWLPKLGNSNAQKEYYLTEIITLAAKEGFLITSSEVSNPLEVQGANDRWQLHELERGLQRYLAQKFILSGVTIADANRFDVRGELHCGEDVFIDVNVVITGKVVLGNGCRIGPNCILNETILGENSEVFANSVLDTCEVENHCQIGPFARVRPGSKLASYCKIGNFVETKNANFAERSKANHLSYIGDASIGKDVNIGAGTITCNYDGVDKHHTLIEDGAFIGSGTQLVAPVVVGENAVIGAGSTIRKNAPMGELTLTESKQKTILGWKKPIKQTP